jgi:hypothetical protein
MTTHPAPLTYRLDHDGPASSTYYPEIAAFTDRVLEHSERTLLPIAKRYRIYLIGYRLEEPRTQEEYLFELLNLGVLWRAYGSAALAVRYAPFHTLARMGDWRKRYPSVKPVIDLIRGVALTAFLDPTMTGDDVRIPRSVSDLQRLVAWLEATGDFREDAFRYIRLLAYLGTLSADHVHAIMTTVIGDAEWFEQESARVVGHYTPNVGTFVARHQSFYRWREDRFSCLRSRTEYHLNMVGAEIMNRAYRDEFLSCTKKTVLLPGCMRLRSAEACEGGKTEKGIRCTGCEPKCRVNQIREHGKRNGYEVMIIPHSTDLAQWKRASGEETAAVVGVACLSVLVQGGWELQRNNIPAQCVLLNECGCKKHWHQQGFPTALDVRELHRIIGN